MTDLETITAERDRLRAENQALTERATQLSGDLTRLRSGKGKIFGGGPVGTVSRDVLQAMSPGARDAFIRTGGIVTD